MARIGPGPDWVDTGGRVFDSSHHQPSAAPTSRPKTTTTVDFFMRTSSGDCFSARLVPEGGDSAADLTFQGDVGIDVGVVINAGQAEAEEF